MLRCSWQRFLHNFNGESNVPTVRLFDNACSLDVSNKLTGFDVGNIAHLRQIHFANTLGIVCASLYNLLNGKRTIMMMLGKLGETCTKFEKTVVGLFQTVDYVLQYLGMERFEPFIDAHKVFDLLLQLVFADAFLLLFVHQLPILKAKIIDKTARTKPLSKDLFLRSFGFEAVCFYDSQTFF